MDLIGGVRRRAADVERGALEIGGQSRGGHSPPEERRRGESVFCQARREKKVEGKDGENGFGAG